MASQVNINNVPNPRAMSIDGSSHVVGWQGITAGNPWIENYPVLRATTGGPSAAIPSYGYYDISSPNPGRANVEVANLELAVRAPSPNTTYTFLGYGSIAAAGVSLTTSIAWYDTVENALDHRAYISRDSSPATALASGLWDSARVVAAAPQGAGALLLSIGFQAAPGVLNTLRAKFSGLLVVESVGANAPYSGEYFDGSTSPSGITSYEWTGTPHESSSAQTIQLTTALTPPSIGMLTVIGKA